MLGTTSAQNLAPSSLSSLLVQAIKQVTQLGEEFRAEGQKLQDLHDRLAEKRFHLAVLGQFKRGKSTLLNALLAEVLLRLRLTIRSLQLPLADLDERRRLFEQKLAEAEQQRVTAQDMLAGDHRRLVALLEEQAGQLRQRARHYFNQIAHVALDKIGRDKPDEQVVQAALAEAIPGFFERELGEMSRAFEQRVSQTLTAHRQRADALVETIHRSAAEVFDLAYQPLDSGDVFTVERQPYWVTHQWRTNLSPFSPQLVDHLLPHRWQRARRLNRLHGQIEALVLRNVENLRWATLQNLDQAIRRFSSALDERLQETAAATHEAIRAAHRQRQDHAETIAQAVARLEAVVNNLEQLQARLQTLSSKLASST